MGSDWSDMGLCLWAESPAEAQNFIRRTRAAGDGFPQIERIFVAKRSPAHRSNGYVGGQYYETTDDSVVDVYDSVVTAPLTLTDLVQWCTCDIMLSLGDNPVVVVEDTTHIVRMNLYQRIPRLARAAMLGVPGLVLQGTRGLDLSKRGDRWAMYRYLHAFDAMGIVHPHSRPIPVWYEATDAAELDAVDRLVRHLVALLDGNRRQVEADRQEVAATIHETMRTGFRGDIPPSIPSIECLSDRVVVHVGVRPGKKSWEQKGSGQMDPYVGMILAAKYMYCYDDQGAQTRPLVVAFTNLPNDFWWFADWENSTSLYKRLPMEFADEVLWRG